MLVAVEEERLARIRRAAGLPPVRALAELFAVSGVDPRDVDCVAYPWLPRAMGVTADETEREVLSWLEQAGLATRRDLQVTFVEHHVAHAWCGLAFVPNGLLGRQVGVLVLDGSGESTSGACFVFDGDLLCRWNLSQTSSLGIYYEAVSHYLGFAWGEEGKTMGMASYGREGRAMAPVLPDQRFAGSLPGYPANAISPHRVHQTVRGGLVDGFRRLNGDHLSFNARADVALTAQDAVGDRVLTYVKELIGTIDVLVLSGGLALNCSINAKVAALCRMRDVELVIPPPASDTGVAIGAAIAAADDPVAVTLPGPFLGREFTPDDIGCRLQRLGVTVEPLETTRLAVELVERSLVCGWFEGRSEVGPRALGKRAIIARPDSAAVRDRVNFLKGRESWRPLAPSLSRDEFARSFGGSTPSAYMLITASATPEANSRLGGVIHVDGTSRPQVVTEPGPYRTLLADMKRACGVEAIICTSFNRAGEPLVYSPEEALWAARTMGLDLLAGDGWCVRLTGP